MDREISGTPSPFAHMPPGQIPPRLLMGVASESSPFRVRPSCSPTGDLGTSFLKDFELPPEKAYFK